jgi:hypothetical protein
MPQRACKNCYSIKSKCEFDRSQTSCSRCLRLGKSCKARLAKRMGRRPLRRDFSYGSYLISELNDTNSRDVFQDRRYYENVEEPPHQELCPGTRQVVKASTTIEFLVEQSSRDDSRSGINSDSILRKFDPSRNINTLQFVGDILHTPDAFFEVHR